MNQKNKIKGYSNKQDLDFYPADEDAKQALENNQTLIEKTKQNLQENLSAKDNQ